MSGDYFRKLLIFVCSVILEGAAVATYWLHKGNAICIKKLVATALGYIISAKKLY